MALAAHRKTSSARDVSDGVLAVALAECAMRSGLGADLVTFSPASETALPASAEKIGVPFHLIGRVAGDRLRIAVGGRLLIDEGVKAIADLWRTAFARAIEAADVL